MDRKGEPRKSVLIGMQGDTGPTLGGRLGGLPGVGRPCRVGGARPLAEAGVNARHHLNEGLNRRRQARVEAGRLFRLETGRSLVGETAPIALLWGAKCLFKNKLTNPHTGVEYHDIGPKIIHLKLYFTLKTGVDGRRCYMYANAEAG